MFFYSGPIILGNTLIILIALYKDINLVSESEKIELSSPNIKYPLLINMGHRV